jgi:hypothetical protein
MHFSPKQTLTIWNLGLWPMHQIQINILESKRLSARFESLSNSSMIQTPVFFVRGVSGVLPKLNRNTHLSFVVTKISSRGTFESRRACPTASSLASI